MALIEDTTKRGRNVKAWRDTADPRRCMAELTIHDQFVRDQGSGLWLPVVESIADDTSLTGFTASVKQMRHQVFMGATANRRWYPDRDRQGQYATVGRPQYRRANGSWANLSLGTLVRAGNVLSFVSTDYILRLTITWRAVKLEYVLNNANAPTAIRFALSLTGMVWDGLKMVSASDGRVEGWLQQMTALDANGLSVPVLETNASGYVTCEVDTAGKTFPIVVDPTLTLQPDATDGNDTILYGPGADNNYGARTAIEHWSSNFITLIAFDLSSLVGATITSASLSFTCVGVISNAAMTITQRRILPANSGWVEGTSNGASEVGAACWNYKAYNTVAWSGSAGCSTVGTDISNTVLATLSLTDVVLDRVDTLSMDTTEFAVMVGANHGIWSKVTSGSGGATYASSDHATASSRPKLVVEYTTGGIAIPVLMRQYRARRT